MLNTEVIMKRTLAVLKLGVVAAVATCLSGGTANAQSLVKGTFTLPYEVHFGRAVLPAGPYTISMDSVRGPAIVRTAAGSGRAMVLALYVEDSLKDQPTALLITKHENERFVSAFNWRGGNTAFVYTPSTKAERKLLGKIDDAVAVPILMAQQ
jgi:hypothetical protein